MAKINYKTRNSYKARIMASGWGLNGGRTYLVTLVGSEGVIAATQEVEAALSRDGRKTVAMTPYEIGKAWTRNNFPLGHVCWFSAVRNVGHYEEMAAEAEAK